ncbi:uncharacterized protein LOC129580565 [Sitodiplosis mosellana]|uniref:uncharacterized protein LOC129580565 n=1 Tax=Sitodiplosis mosellana TaxID=263140 RepID=UPI0024448A0A|nr:uncharacterized protein LOC129580565 [Sitodiplosis mosellana]
MSGLTDCGYFVLILIVTCGLTVAQVPNPCVKFDFDRPANEFLPHFIVKVYNAATNPKPFRPNYHNFLTNISPGYFLAPVSTPLTFNQSSTIETLLYFQPVGTAWLDISIRDIKTNMVTQMIHLSTFTNWQLFQKVVGKPIPEGRLELAVSMTPQSIFAIQFLNVVNPVINKPECKSTPIPPLPSPSPSITPRPPAPTQAPGPGSGSIVNPNEIWWWVIGGICLAILVVIITLALVYCIVDSCCSRSSK